MRNAQKKLNKTIIKLAKKIEKASNKKTGKLQTKIEALVYAKNNIG